MDVGDDAPLPSICSSFATCASGARIWLPMVFIELSIVSLGFEEVAGTDFEDMYFSKMIMKSIEMLIIDEGQ